MLSRVAFRRVFQQCLPERDGVTISSSVMMALRNTLIRQRIPSAAVRATL